MPARMIGIAERGEANTEQLFSTGSGSNADFVVCSRHSGDLAHPLDWAHPSKMKVSSMVTRYSAIFPLLTLAFCSIT